MNSAEHKFPDRPKLTPKEKGDKARRECRLPIEERMAMRTNKDAPNGCHQWHGAITWQGYGQIGWKGKMLRAHRVAWELSGRELPVEPYVLHHRCYNTLCVNPAHMEIVTRYENAVTLSNSAWGVNARKTHCKRGHEFTPENTMYSERKGRPGRQCRACRAMYPLKQHSK